MDVGRGYNGLNLQSSIRNVAQANETAVMVNEQAMDIGEQVNIGAAQQYTANSC
ncbi:MAG: hypothetical protein WC686_01905 [Candidatus Shapirobacteria bacterium]|jgi:hypothetical protein